MDLRQYYLQKLIISREMQEGAKQLIIKMKNDNIKMDTLSNLYEDFTDRLELSDYLSFCQFLESRKGKRRLKALEGYANEDCQKLGGFSRFRSGKI